MKRIITITLILFFQSSTILHCKKKEINKTNAWSAYQGKMTWQEAKAKCASIEKRLPTRAEFEATYKVKMTKSWEKDGMWYWNSIS